MDQSNRPRCPYCLYPLTDGSCGHCRADDQKPNPPELLPVGFVVGDRYTVGSAIHVNSEATLYAAYDAAQDRVLALREYFPGALAQRLPGGRVAPIPGKEVQYKALRMDFEEVCRFLSGQRSDMCIIPCLDVVAWGDTVYGAFPESKGRKLEAVLDERGGRIGWQEIKTAYLKLLGTVATINSRGIIHRGISSTTIHFDPLGRLVLTGFGTSAFRTGHSEIEAELFYGYAAPEQYTQRGWQGNWTDVYALGAVLYRILTGQRPADYHARLTGEALVPPEDFDPTIPHHVSDAIMKAMALDVESRYASADDLQTALLEDKDNSTAVFDVVEMQPVERPKRRAKTAGITLGITLCLLGVALAMLFQTGFIPTGRPVENPDEDPSNLSETESEAPTEPEPQVIKAPTLTDIAYDDILKNGAIISRYNFAEPIYLWNESVHEGYVISQNPPADSDMLENDAITLTVSLGSEYATMPNIAGWELDEAGELLDQLGIRYEVFERADASYTHGFVEGSSIPYGAEFSRRDQTVYLYTGRRTN